MRLKKDNRGSAMIIIIVAIAFVSILVSTLYTVVALNVQMKSVDRKSKKNFYSAEGVLEQINLGLQGEMSIAAEKAYRDIMKSYTSSRDEGVRQQKFNNYLIDELSDKLKIAAAPTTDPLRYDVEVLKGYLQDDVKEQADGTGAKIDTPEAGATLIKGEDNLILKGVKITYTDSDGYQSIIETDIRLASPNLNLVESGDIPSIFEYSLIANEQLRQVSGARTNSVFIRNNVYAGEGGINLDVANAKWTFEGSGRVVSKGDVKVDGATLTIDQDKELWANEIGVGTERLGGNLNAKGRTYVADDLEVGGNRSSVTLGGEYYGFGNGYNLDASGESRVPGGASSAILVNGTGATLNMSNLQRLLISGSAQIATGSEEYDPKVVGRTSLDKNEYDNMKGGTIANGFYKIHSAENTADYWTTLNRYAVVDNVETIIRVVYNADGTSSLYDNSAGKYYKVNTDGSITADADRISTETKFKPEYPQGKPGQYALKAVLNDKYVTISDRNALTATRDKVTNEYQLFIFESTTMSVPVTADINNALEPGTYAIYSYSEARYLQSTGRNNPVLANATTVGGTADQFEQFTLEKEGDDGQFSLRTVNNPGYLTEVTNAAERIIQVKPNTGNRDQRVKIKLEPSDVGAGFYYLRTEGNYLFVDEVSKEFRAVPATMENPATASEQQKRSASFQFVLINPDATAVSGETEVPTGTSVYPVYGMTYSDEDSAVATIQAPAGSGMTIAEARIRYQITSNGAVSAEATSNMTINGGKASATITGLKNGDSVLYSISYRFASETVLRTADRNVYIHQRYYADGSPYENSNRNVNLGESVEIKSNQIAYLVPSECVGVYKGKTIFGHNPMTADEWNKLEAAAKDVGTYPDGFEIVALKKPISSLGNKTLEDYAGVGNKGYQEVFVQTGGDSMVYLYVNFIDSEKTSEYFQDYYGKNQDTMQGYMNQYVDKLETGSFDRLTLDGNMVTSLDGSKIDLRANGNYGPELSATEQKEEEQRYQQQYLALCTNLTLNYTSELTGDVYDNVVNDGAIRSYAKYGDGIGANGLDGTVTAIAKIVVGDYIYPSADVDEEKVCLILSTGNVTVNGDYSGIIIAKGDIILSDGVTISNNRDALKRILQVQIENAAGKKTTIAKEYFNVDLYGEGSGATVKSETGYAKYADCISYENWQKK